MADAVEFVLNGEVLRVEGISPNCTLLEFLRARGLTGTKEGCAEGDCGACSVAVLEPGPDAEGVPNWRTVNSCLLPVVCLAGREVVTIEGVAGKDLHPIQHCLVAHHGSQCGYCTPGIVMSMFEAWHRQDLTEPWQLDDQLQGNLCRCTGYRPVRDAARDAVALASKQGSMRRGASPVLIPAVPEEYSFDGEKFFRPTTLEQLAQILRRHREARVLAGGTELALDITKRFKRFSSLVSLEGIAELNRIEADGDGGCWRIGAAVPLTTVDERLGDEFPALRQMIRLFGSRQIRHRATLGGNLATASPIGDVAPLLMAFDARLELAGSASAQVAVDEFFTGYRKTRLVEGQIISAILLPRELGHAGGDKTLAGFYKVSKRREMDIATVSGAFRVELKEGRVAAARLVFGGVGATVMRARRTEQQLMNQPWNERTVLGLRGCLAGEFEPISDMRGSKEFRRALVPALVEKFFREGGAGGVGGQDVSAKRHSPQPFPANPAVALGQLAGRDACPALESAHLHVTGEARYTDDFTAGRSMLEVWPVCSPHAHARILRRDAAVARRMPGIHAVLLAEDIPGVNDVGVVKQDEPLFAVNEVLFQGQVVGVVVGDTLEACRAAAEKVEVEYEPLSALFGIEQAIAAGSFHNDPNYIRRGDVAGALAAAPERFHGEFTFGGQDHFYLETQASFAEPGENGTMRVVSSTQHPSEVQGAVAQVLGVPDNRVVVEVPRVGGGFGGKETQAAAFAAWAALAARHTRRPVRVRLNRDQDMMLTGKRHPFLARFEVGYDREGLLHAVKAELYSNGGWSLDLSQAVTDRALFHLDNSYYIPHVEFRGQVTRTHLASNTAFRGFGGPQGMLVIEEILARMARRLGVSPERVRERNLYRGAGETNTTPYGQDIGDTRLQTIWHELKRSSCFDERRTELAAWNAAHPYQKRGLAITPVKFGISFTVTHLNQAGALVLLYQDGSAQVNHGGIEMGQGIHTNILAIAARALGISEERLRVMPTSTDKVPNTSATAASAGTDLNGAAVKNACETLIARLKPVATRELGRRFAKEILPEDLVFADNVVMALSKPEVRMLISEVIGRAYTERISLSATGYYRTPGITWDRAAGRGKPFHYFSNGAAVSEVEVDRFTGMVRVLRADILQDAGESIHLGVNRGQIEGGFVQGMGWLTGEELVWDASGRLLTHSPDTYKIPAFGDAPEFRVNFLERASEPGVIHGSKAVGEPPLMLAISVREAIRDAIGAFGAGSEEIRLDSPATCEAIFMSIGRHTR